MYINLSSCVIPQAALKSLLDGGKLTIKYVYVSRRHPHHNYCCTSTTESPEAHHNSHHIYYAILVSSVKTRTQIGLKWVYFTEELGTHSNLISRDMSLRAAKFIIFNAQLLVFDTKFIIFNAQFLVLNTKFVICSWI